MHSLRLFNSLTREVETVRDSDGLVRMFTCGPTVYKTQHVGNMRTFLLSDLIVRRLQQLGRQVSWIVNITDVGHPSGDDDWNEDKLQLEAVERRRSALEIARQYEAEFFADWKQLNLTPPEAFPRASEHVDEIIELVRQLEEKGYGYVAGRDVAFDVGKFPTYGELSGHQLSALRSSEETLAAGRHSPNDFALWRGSSEGTVMEWPSPWGTGYPGWHIEDTAI
ncbi:MAG: class I tRNA ligase family protein, partial [Candidatus Dormibacteraceae bacterium]